MNKLLYCFVCLFLVISDSSVIILLVMEGKDLPLYQYSFALWICIVNCVLFFIISTLERLIKTRSLKEAFIFRDTKNCHRFEISGVIGFLWGFNYVCIFTANPMTKGIFQVIYNQLNIVFVMIGSMYLLGKRYHKIQYIASLIAIISGFIPIAETFLGVGSSNGKSGRDVVFYNLIYIVGIMCMALVNIFSESVLELRNDNGNTYNIIPIEGDHNMSFFDEDDNKAPLDIFNMDIKDNNYNTQIPLIDTEANIDEMDGSNQVSPMIVNDSFKLWSTSSLRTKSFKSERIESNYMVSIPQLFFFANLWSIVFVLSLFWIGGIEYGSDFWSIFTEGLTCISTFCHPSVYYIWIACLFTVIENLTTSKLIREDGVTMTTLFTTFSPFITTTVFGIKSIFKSYYQPITWSSWFSFVLIIIAIIMYKIPTILRWKVRSHGKNKLSFIKSIINSEKTINN